MLLASMGDGAAYRSHDNQLCEGIDSCKGHGHVQEEKNHRKQFLVASGKPQDLIRQDLQGAIGTENREQHCAEHDSKKQSGWKHKSGKK